MIVRRSASLAVLLDISHLKTIVPGMRMPYSPPASSTCIEQGSLAKQKIWMLCLVSVMALILLPVGSGPSHSSPLPLSLQTLATKLGGSGSRRFPRLSNLFRLSLGNNVRMMESSQT